MSTSASLAIRSPLGAPATDFQVLIVHGAMDRAANFERVRRRIADLPVVSYDRRGYAASRYLPVVADLSLQVSDLLSVVGRTPSVLVGHSFGGLIALAAAVEVPDRIRSIGVYEAPMPWFEWWPAPFEDAEPHDIAETFFRQMVGDESWDSAPASFRADRRAEGAALLADFETAGAGLGFDLSDVLSAVAAAHGSLTAPHFRSSAEQLCESIPGTELTVIEGASHGAHLSHPDQFAAWIRRAVALSSQ